MNPEIALKKLCELNQKLEHLNSASALIQWDMRTCAPAKAAADRSALLAFLAGEIHRLHTATEIPELLAAARNHAELTDAEKAMLRNTEKRYDRGSRVPTERMEAYAAVLARSEAVWQEARGKNDWNSFAPRLKEVMDFQKELADCYGYEQYRYDALLEQYEPGASVAFLDRLFSSLRDESIALLACVRSSGVKINQSFLTQPYSPDALKDFVSKIIAELGFDFAAGRLDVSAHPFTTAFGNKDIRITTFKPGANFSASLFAVIHESGHGIYEQQTSDTLKGTGLATGISMGIHESQSRFFENMLGRSRAFWEHFYPALQKALPAFSTVDREDFYRAINAVEPGLIRTSADELTYNLHIIIRYELEKALMAGDLSVDDLPGAWNEKYRAYLGVEPQCYAEGVMQDIHWASGAVGYFPSYALGNLYSAQFAHKLTEELPDWQREIAAGDFSGVRTWLGEKIHRHGSVYLPTELIVMATGEPLNPAYFTNYLKEKFKSIYKV